MILEMGCYCCWFVKLYGSVSSSHWKLMVLCGSYLQGGYPEPDVLMHLMECEVQANVCLWFALDGVLASVMFVPFIVHVVFVSSALG
ncbi:unnamed protein product [Camellia sinensis]